MGADPATLVRASAAHPAGLKNLGRGLHSSTVLLNLSVLYGIGDERRGCVACVKGV